MYFPLTVFLELFVNFTHKNEYILHSVFCASANILYYKISVDAQNLFLRARKQ